MQAKLIQSYTMSLQFVYIMLIKILCKMSINQFKLLNYSLKFYAHIVPVLIRLFQQRREYLDNVMNCKTLPIHNMFAVMFSCNKYTYIAHILKTEKPVVWQK